MRSKEEIDRVIKNLVGISDYTRNIFREIIQDSYHLGFSDGRHNKNILEDSLNTRNQKEASTN